MFLFWVSARTFLFFSSYNAEVNDVINVEYVKWGVTWCQVGAVEHAVCRTQEPLLPGNSEVSNEHGKWVVFSSVCELWVPAHSKLPAIQLLLQLISVVFWVEFKVLSANLRAVRGPWISLQKSKAGRMLELSAVGSWFLNSLEQKWKLLFVHIQEPSASLSSLLEWRSLCLKQWLLPASSLFGSYGQRVSHCGLLGMAQLEAKAEGWGGVVPCQRSPCLNVSGFWNTAVFRFPTWSGVGVFANNPESYNSSASKSVLDFF